MLLYIVRNVPSGTVITAPVSKQDDGNLLRQRLGLWNSKRERRLREFSLKLEGRRLLVYGANGAGKSSLYSIRRINRTS